MSFGDVNKLVINDKDGLATKQNSEVFYRYLLSNNVAYNYCKRNIVDPNPLDEKILAVGEKFNNRYKTTLSLIKGTCENNNIDFALFKTYKYINEAVDGDIDLVVKEKDFNNFLGIMKGLGFECQEDEPLKGRCEKEGYSKIEPRVTVSYHGMEVFNEPEIWKNVYEVSVDGLSVLSTTKEFDSICLLLNVLYGPKYVSLYLYWLTKGIGSEVVKDLTDKVEISEDINFISQELLDQESLKKKFPLFLDNTSFIIWWLKRILFNGSFTLKERFKHLVFFYYIKYKYILFNKLHFEHKWI